ncbi:hypothetical protein SEA_GIBBLES_88 [Gordonia phage Gibbles]|nr:hypothetical protein SEA_GIBBLES_88 [Gordonia phage Gibbles]
MSMNPTARPVPSSMKQTLNGESRSKAVCCNCHEPITQFEDILIMEYVWIHDISHKKDCEF